MSAKQANAIVISTGGLRVFISVEFRKTLRTVSRQFAATRNSSARATKRFPSSRCSSAIQIVRPLDSTVEDAAPTRPGGFSTLQEGLLFVGLALKSRSQKLGGGVGRLGRVRRVFFCFVVGVLVLTTDIVGAAAGVGVVVGNAAGVGVVVGNAAGVGVVVGNAAGVGVVVGNAAGVGRITAVVCAVSVAAAGTCWGIDLFAIPNTIATTAEKIPTIPLPIAQRARRCVCSCRASLRLRSISLCISVSRSEAVMISFGGSIESAWISEK
jgi:hypothetical protein